MRMKIKIKIDDDRVYRYSAFPYDIKVSELTADIDNAVKSTISEMNFRQFTSCEQMIWHDGSWVGMLKITVKE